MLWCMRGCELDGYKAEREENPNGDPGKTCGIKPRVQLCRVPSTWRRGEEDETAHGAVAKTTDETGPGGSTCRMIRWGEQG